MVTEFTAHSGDVRLSCRRRGRGAPLLLVMGAAGHHRTWGESFVARLAGQFEVITFEHRGIGASTTTDSFDLDDLLADTIAVLDWSGLADAHVLGFALGGALAQRLAVAHPQRLRSLTLQSTWGDNDNVWGDGVLKLAGAGKADDPETGAWMMFEANLSATFTADETRFAAFRDGAASVHVPAAVVANQLAAAAKHDLLGELGSVTAPTLVVHGTQDSIIRCAAGERVAWAIPGAHLELWPGLGHLLSWEAPERLAGAVLAHAKTHH